MNEKKLLIGIIVLSIIGVAVWMYFETKPKPGEIQEDKGRSHVEIGTVVEYHTNPPTSGPHYAQWTKWGVYDVPKDDRNLVHSLEHGYVIMSYNCDIRESAFNLVPAAYAQMDDTPMSVASESAQADASAAAQLSGEFKSESCLDLVAKLKEIYDAKGQVRLLVVPNNKIDTRIALSAWRYLDKFNNFDKKRIENFISAHINQGPEKTLE